jgi:hypothetical protein
MTKQSPRAPRIIRLHLPGEPDVIRQKYNMQMDREVALVIKKMARYQRMLLSDFLSDMVRVYAMDQNWPIENDGATGSQARPPGAGSRLGNRLLTHDGVTLPLADWAVRTGINRNTLSSRLRAGYSVAEALTTQPRRRAP